MSDCFALLLLESPWWNPDINPTRASALPFFQGLERLHDYFNIYYSTFYDTRGFEVALSQDLIHTHEKRQILYIGAHGNETSIANGRASTLLEKVALHGDKIEGVIVSSCLVGARESNLWAPILINKTRWIFAYRHEVGWLDSLFIELALLEALALAEENYADDREILLQTFSEALAKFNPKMPLGSAGEPLSECVCLMQRAKYKRNPENLTSALIDLAWSDQ
ncbi:hypothetical protein [Stutzerimonas stutzeri]|uniref:hypothetical protein n=1 Tax=Stutzerimonas stutzeri TaxID=316 RepID=UPI000C45211D|nr:hypothetical protein [Planctomycetaceae bacterium]|tara:strand:+ start:10524 stop:11192 length:669 start_codon:yes stop_codon:yes gene_type:complete